MIILANYYTPYSNQNINNDYFNNIYFQEQTAAKHERREIRKLGNIMGITLTFFVFFPDLSLYILKSLNLYDRYQQSFLFQNAFSIISGEIIRVLLLFGIMAVINRKKYESDIVPSKKISFGKTVLWVGFGMLCCSLANYLVSIVIAIFGTFGYQLKQYDMLEPNSVFACVLAAFSTAVIPAVCEEFAMRCCALGLVKKYGKAFGVVSISMIFGLMHGNVIQFVFATACGLVLGYVTVKTESIVPAVLIHGFNNGMSVVNSIVIYAFGEEASKYSLASIMIFWIVVGIICTVILFVKKQFKHAENNQPQMFFRNSFGSKLASFFFVPGMIIPFVSLISLTILTIEKI